MSRIYPIFMKRVLDLCVVIPSMLFFFPLIAISFLIPGVRLRKKRRVGRKAKPFNEYRLRCPSAGIGHTLQRISFHRLPALWNIFCGQMSFIGPQALREDEPLPGEGSAHPRFTLRPGYVGPWWVRERSNMRFDDQFSVDTDYVQNVSLKADAGIFLRATLARIYGKDVAVEYKETLSLLGVRVDNLTTAEAIARIDQAIQGKSTVRVSFVNADSLNKAFSDEAFCRVLNSSDLVLGDGIGIKLGAKLTQQFIRENVNGTDLFPRLCEHMSQNKQRLYLLGAKDGIPQRVRDWVNGNHSGVCVCGTRNGFFQPSENDEVCQGIRDAQPDVLLVAQGAPRQETWIRDNMDSLGTPVAIGVGGLFDFYSGQTARAPIWMREAGVEWLYRLIQEPRRMFKRYLVGNFVFILRVLRQRRKK